MMTKILLNLVVVATLLCLSCELAAQSDIALATRKAKLQELSEKLKRRDENNRQEAWEFARRVGIPVRRELPNGKVLELQRIAPGIGPVFYITYNTDAADTVSTDEVWPGGSTGLDLDGSGMTAAQWDGGAIFTAHPDFAGGRVTQVDGATIISEHSTHVAGTLVGAGEWLYAESRGMVYGAHLNAYDWNSDTAEMALAAANGQLTSNHSYGIAAGWIYTGDPIPPNTWWWIGGADPSDLEDPYFGYYDSETQLWDQIAFDAPFYLIVKAAGNDRTDIGPAPGEEYTVIDQDGNPLFTSTLPRPADCAPAGYDCLPTASVAKNVLTVGAVDDIIGGYSPLTGPSAVQMADFSSWGPTDDGRIKPDVVGNGMFLLSAFPEPYYYALAAGTSMSAPNVTGSLLLLQQHYQDIHGVGNFMRASTLKALAIHTADESGDADGPDYEFGWGLLNTKTAAQVISLDGGGAHQIIEGSLAQGAEDTFEFTVTGSDAILTATLVWTDPPGTPVALSLDAPDSMLVNDLDLRIDKSPFTHMPWILNPASPSDAATTGDNFRDNVEQVEVGSAGAGSYFVKVSHKGTLLNGNNQEYSLIISETAPPPTGSGLLIDEDFSGGLPAGWSVVTVSGVSWTIKTPVPGHSRLDNQTGGSGNFAMVDNGWCCDTYTSLVTPTFDMSSTTAAVLRFKSFFWADEGESINVDISTDGGAGWTNVWTTADFNPNPTNYVFDLSGVAAGQASFTLRFRYDSGVGPIGNLWQVDSVEFEVFGGGPPASSPPGQATGPSPADAAAGVGINSDLSWTAGGDADSHDVYFSVAPSPPASQGNQAGVSFDPGPLGYDTTYYWRIDEVNGDGTTQGAIWSFTTEAAPPNPPDSATSPSPGDGATEVNIDSDLSWTAGAGATSHDVYFGTNPSPASQGNQAGTSFVLGTLAYDTLYYWRIDEVNGDGTTTGATWSFTTEAAPLNPPDPATSPSPGDGATAVNIDSDLSWTAGAGATSHDVYFGTNPSPASQGNQAGTSFVLGTLTYDTLYYWRIDEVNGDGTTTGATWSFTTEAAPAVPPGQASSPNPSDGATAVNIDSDLSWAAGAGATSHDLYFGTNPSPASQGNQAGTSFVLGPLAYDTLYYWRIDEVNGDGTTTGATWSFTTEAAPQTINLAGLSGSMTPGSRGRWSAAVEISVEDQDDNPESEVTVQGTWSNGATGSPSCITDINGLCTVEKNNLKGKVSSVTFTVDSLSGAGSTYNPADNLAGDSITVSQGNTDQTPIAPGDKYQTLVDESISGNIIGNDDQGDGPSYVNNNTLPSNGNLILSNDGGFTYTPNNSFEGSDSFIYSIVDQDGDVSNSAVVSITVSGAEPPPPAGERTVSLLPYKVKGLQHVEVTWLNYSSGTVDILRDGNPVAESLAGNNGTHEDNIGVKGGGQTYTYQVCEAGTGTCVSAITGF